LRRLSRRLLRRASRPRPRSRYGSAFSGNEDEIEKCLRQLKNTRKKRSRGVFGLGRSIKVGNFRRLFLL
jgi:hypothetical protein